MTMTALFRTPTRRMRQTVPQPAPEIRDKPTKGRVVAAYMVETGCTKPEAKQLFAILSSAVEQMRNNGYYMYHFNDDELKLHGVLEIVMPDDITARPGSAHALTEAHLLEGDELGLMHTRDHSREVEYCAVELRMHKGA